MSDLRACPFCGGGAKIYSISRVWFIGCSNECCRLWWKKHEGWKDRQELIEEWNHRPQLDKAVGAMEKSQEWIQNDEPGEAFEELQEALSETGGD